MSQTIIDENNRKGTVVETREGGVFARPEGVPAHVEAKSFVGMEGKAKTETFWSYQADGSLRGLWYDSPINGFMTAKLEK